jgi:hypothetical protein
MNSPKKRLTVILLSISFILLIPYLAMEFTNEVNWTASDFLVMGILLLATGLGIEFVLRTAKKTEQRILLILAVLALFFAVWAELAVGIIGRTLAAN